MARAASKRQSLVKVDPTAGTPPPAEFKSFRSWDPDLPELSFTRYWYAGPGQRDGIAEWVRRKLKPGDHPRFGWAAKMEVLLPSAAPGDYADIEFLLDRFDDTLPPFESHIMVQVKIALDPAMPWHAGYEQVRAFARDHFAKRFPVILIAHVPGTAGLEGYGNHVHCIVLGRPLGIDGLGGTCHKLCSDIGYGQAMEAWRAHSSRWRAT